jgi:hypothetical protein
MQFGMQCELRAFPQGLKSQLIDGLTDGLKPVPFRNGWHQQPCKILTKVG